MFLSLFAVNLAPLKFSSLSPSLRLKLHGAPLVMLTFLYFFFLAPSACFFHFFLSFSLLFLFFLTFFLSFCFFSFPVFFLFGAPFGDPGGHGPPKPPPRYAPAFMFSLSTPSPYASYFSLSSLLESFNLES